ncbi:MAG: ThuA domain-containing protein, partial [Lachnospiraceae bacterium]|nr:ThuA domain-containing protein [Lachnospiraceae bacterium]
MMKITVWNEYLHERTEEAVRQVYPEGIHACIRDFLVKNGFTDVRTATLDEPEHGLTQEVLDDTDVLFWWGHMRHHMVSDEVVQRVFDRVQDGMGLIVLHSGHESKIMQRLMGTQCSLRWHEN